MGPAASVHLFAALCSGDPVAKPVSKGWRSQEYVPLQHLQPSCFLLHRCLGHTPRAPLGRFYHHPTRLWYVLPTLTCPCGGDDFWLAAGTISLGGVGSNCDGVGGFWQQASNDRLLGAHPRGGEEANEKSKCLLLELAKGRHWGQHLQQQHTDTLAGSCSCIALKHTHLAQSQQTTIAATPTLTCLISTPASNSWPFQGPTSNLCQQLRSPTASAKREICSRDGPVWSQSHPASASLRVRGLWSCEPEQKPVQLAAETSWGLIWGF